MDDRLYPNSKNNHNNDNSHNSYTSEPHYETEPDEDMFDDFYTQQDDFAGNSKQNSARFKVNIPDEDSFGSSADSSSQSRVPKGKPVASSRQDPFLRDNNLSESAAQNRRNRTPTGAPVRDQSQNFSKNSAANSNNPSLKRNDFSIEKQQHRARPVSKSSLNSEDVSSTSKRPKNKKAKKGGKGKKIAVSIICIILVLLLGVFAYGYSILGKINYDTEIRSENQYISSKELASSSKVRNILFIGSDARGDVQGMRSDTMMLFSIDKAHKKIKLTSFLRDSYVCIPSTGNYRKLNAACSAGGAQLVIDTIEYNFKVDIDNYVLVDFEAFKTFIDSIGGLDVDGVTEAEAKYMRDVVKAPNVKEGKNHFTGGAALWYCRIRYLDDDFHRTERQRKVISALMTQIAKTNPVTLLNAIEEIMPMISTDIPRNDFIGLGLGAVTQYLRYDIVQHQIPAEGTWSDPYIRGEGQVLKMDIDKNTKLLYDFLYSDESEESTEKK
ncbi:MAG: LCP family protein [Acutalibacteraceae bacterium]